MAARCARVRMSGLCGDFEKYCHAVVNRWYLDRQRQGAGPERRDYRRSTLVQLRQSIGVLFPDDVQARELRIDAWLPPAIAEIVKRDFKGWSVSGMEQIPVASFHAAARDLFAFRIILPKTEVAGPDLARVARTAELRRILLERRVSHANLLNRMFRDHGVVVVRADFVGSNRVFDVVRPNLPDRCLIAFPADRLVLPAARPFWGIPRPETVAAAINHYLETGDIEPVRRLQGWRDLSDYFKLAPVKLICEARRKIVEEAARIRYFPDLLDQIPPVSWQPLPIDRYCRDLLDRAHALELDHVLWLEIPYGATSEAWRKPDVNTPDVVHQSLRRAADGPHGGGQSRSNVCVALCLMHDMTGGLYSPLYEALVGWQHGDFGIPGPFPPGLAELQVSRLGALKEVFGNYEHLLVMTVNHKGSDGGGGNGPPPRPSQPVGEQRTVGAASGRARCQG